MGKKSGSRIDSGKPLEVGRFPDKSRAGKRLVTTMTGVAEALNLTGKGRDRDRGKGKEELSIFERRRQNKALRKLHSSENTDTGEVLASTAQESLTGEDPARTLSTEEKILGFFSGNSSTKSGFLGDAENSSSDNSLKPSLNNSNSGDVMMEGSHRTINSGVFTEELVASSDFTMGDETDDENYLREAAGDYSSPLDEARDNFTDLSKAFNTLRLETKFAPRSSFRGDSLNKISYDNSFVAASDGDKAMADAYYNYYEKKSTNPPGSSVAQPTGRGEVNNSRKGFTHGND